MIVVPFERSPPQIRDEITVAMRSVPTEIAAGAFPLEASP